MCFIISPLHPINTDDVVLHVRENHEIHASLVAFRTNSGFARCFLNEWILLGAIHLVTLPHYRNAFIHRFSNIWLTFFVSLAQHTIVHDPYQSTL